MSGSPCAPYFSERSIARIACSNIDAGFPRHRWQVHRPRSDPASSGGASRNGTTSSSSDRSPVRATYVAATYGSHSRSSEHRVRVPRPAGGCHQCCTSPSTNWREAASTRWARHRSGREYSSDEHVLQLIAESERAAGLVRAAPRPDAATERLIQQPAIHQQIERIVRACAPAPRRACRPRTARSVRSRVDGLLRRRRIVAASSAACAAVVSLAEHERDAARFARRDLDRDLQGGAGIEPGADASAKLLAEQPRRRGQRAVAADEIARDRR